LTAPVDQEMLAEACQIMKNDRKIGYIDFDADTHNYSQTGVLYYPHSKEDFLVETTAKPMLCVSLVRTVYFKHLLRKGEDPWTFESFAYWRAKFCSKKCLLYARRRNRPLWPAPFGGVIHGGRLLDDYRYLFNESELMEADRPKGRPESFFLRLPGSLANKKFLYQCCRVLSIFHLSRSKIVRKN